MDFEEVVFEEVNDPHWIDTFFGWEIQMLK